MGSEETAVQEQIQHEQEAQEDTVGVDKRGLLSALHLCFLDNEHKNKKLGAFRSGC